MQSVRDRLQQALRALESGDAPGAVSHAAAAVAAAPTVGVAWLVLGRAQLASGDTGAGLQALRRATELDPGSAEAWATLGVALQGLGQVEEPLRCFETALRLAPTSPSVLVRVGNFLVERGQLAEAETCFRAACGPGQGAARSDGAPGLLLLAERRGDLVGATALIDTYSSLLGRNAAFTAAAARVLLRTGRGEEARAALDVLPIAALGRASRVGVEHMRGDVLEALGDAEGALHAHARAHAARGLSWDSDAHSARVDALIHGWTRERFQASSRTSGDLGDDVVLIVGMPRSGTTLTEQMLLGHPDVRSCGELDELPQIERELERGAREPAALDTAAARYLARLRRDGRAHRILDKLPVNFLSLRTAACLFPAARVIHLRRDPVDTCVSCYSKDLHATLAWATDLRALGRFYADYTRLMDHWLAELPLPICELRYEQLVEAPEAEVRRVSAFLGLTYEPQCLRFFERPEVAHTASYAQVRRPLNRDAIGRAAKVAGLLGELTQGLAGRASRA